MKTGTTLMAIIGASAALLLAPMKSKSYSHETRVPTIPAQVSMNPASSFAAGYDHDYGLGISFQMQNVYVDAFKGRKSEVRYALPIKIDKEGNYVLPGVSLKAEKDNVTGAVMASIARLQGKTRGGAVVGYALSTGKILKYPSEMDELKHSKSINDIIEDDLFKSRKGFFAGCWVGSHERNNYLNIKYSFGSPALSSLSHELGLYLGISNGRIGIEAMAEAALGGYYPEQIQLGIQEVHTSGWVADTTWVQGSVFRGINLTIDDNGNVIQENIREPALIPQINLRKVEKLERDYLGTAGFPEPAIRKVDKEIRKIRSEVSRRDVRFAVKVKIPFGKGNKRK